MAANDTAATLRRAAAQARADAQDTAGPGWNIALNYATWLANEADRVEDGDTSTLPPALASARAYLEGA
jgi:hypothetical protein